MNLCLGMGVCMGLGLGTLDLAALDFAALAFDPLALALAPGAPTLFQLWTLVFWTL